MPRCSFIKKDGSRCLAFATTSDPDGFCVFHSQKKPWNHPPETMGDDEMEKILTAQLRSVRRQKKLSPLERAREVRALTQLILTIRAGGPPVEPGTKSFDDRLKKWKGKQPLNEGRP
jgi:hypothetical protein